jgi:uncharacterized protein
MFSRDIQQTLIERLSQFPIVALIGPRQSGKTTLLQSLPQYDYLNLESPDTFEQIKTDPKAFLTRSHQTGLIIDEAQKMPELFSYLQVIADEHKKKGEFILSGSQNFLLNQQISQSLAGRVGLLELLPLSYREYQSHPDHRDKIDLWTWLYNGAYPRPYQENIPAKIWMDNYVRTYLERDVRQLLQIKDLAIFQRFLRLCAGRHAQLLNIQELSIDCGISQATTNHWLSVLEASYIIYRLAPYHQNFNKRLIKSNKLYFYDAGLVCYLLGIDSPQYLSIHASRGAIFEGFVISEIKKYFSNHGTSQNLYFWRDHHGIEIDCLFEYQNKLMLIEIKSSTTFQKDFLKNLKKVETFSTSEKFSKYLIYAGEEKHCLCDVALISWDKISQIFEPKFSS